MIKIRFKTSGRIRSHHYRIVVSDSRNIPNGGFIEQLGYYDKFAKTENNLVVDEELTLKWLNAGAVPSDSVKTVLKTTGIWAKYIATKKTAEKSEHVKKEVNKTSGKYKAEARKEKLARQEARVARHKAKRLEKRADKQPSTEENA